MPFEPNPPEDEKKLSGSFKPGKKPNWFPKYKEVCYVVTNPPKNTKLNAEDQVFVLSQEDPQAYNNWNDLHFYQKTKNEKVEPTNLAG